MKTIIETIDGDDRGGFAVSGDSVGSESRFEGVIELTDDGSATLRNGPGGDTYHSTRGAVGEARHVFIEAGFGAVARLSVSAENGDNAVRRGTEPVASTARIGDAPTVSGNGIHTDTGNGLSGGDAGRTSPGDSTQADSGDVLRIFEMGFGTGLNAWLTLQEARQKGRRVEYVAVEKHPVPRQVAGKLGYTQDPRFDAMHAAPWGEWAQISAGFRLLKLHGGAAGILEGMLKPAKDEMPPCTWWRSAGFAALHRFDLVYWDAFAPETQPELWTPEIFAAIATRMARQGVLVTYSAKGDVRRALQTAGFEVEKLPGALGKRHMLRATRL